LRLFNKKQRYILYALAKGKCQKCEIKLKSNFHADHIKPFSKLGKTIIDNGQALCPECNIIKRDKI